ncbi:helix-turn-helix domain-containing protein [Magnetococcus marinus]|uniref:helix-turn-helix domain-containing protein n=1 Tax=Magnetococcus marinus TaxID=1124597 RepID=UPI00003C549A|nr:helix-turn-helix domain-containing protein [Magnetococcus marinus]
MYIPCNQNQPIQLISPKQAASMLGIEVTTLSNWRVSKRYPLSYVRIGRKIMYRLQDVEQFIQSRAVNVQGHSSAFGASA